MPRPLHALVSAFALRTLSGCATTPPPPPEPSPPPPSAPSATAPVATPKPTAEEVLEILNKGAWTARDPSSGWYLRYRFRGHRYSTAGYPAWEESGRIEVLGNSELVLRFTDRIFDGRKDEPVEEAIELAKDGSFFIMNGRRYVHERSTLVAATEDPAEDESGTE